MISVRTCNFWDSFCTVVPVLGFVLFFFPVKSPLLPGTLASTIVLSTQYSTSTSTSTFSTFDTCVCARALLYIHEASHTCMYVLRTTCYVSSCFLHRHVCTQHCCTKHCYLLLLLITAVQVVYRSGGGVRVHRGYLRLYHTQLMHRYGYELHIVYNSRSAPMLKWSEGYPQDGILSVGNSERFGIDKHFIT